MRWPFELVAFGRGQDRNDIEAWPVLGDAVVACVYQLLVHGVLKPLQDSSHRVEDMGMFLECQALHILDDHNLGPLVPHVVQREEQRDTAVLEVIQTGPVAC